MIIEIQRQYDSIGPGIFPEFIRVREVVRIAQIVSTMPTNHLIVVVPIGPGIDWVHIQMNFDIVIFIFYRFNKCIHGFIPC